MIYLIISDIHGNLPALEILLKKEKNNYDAVINLGDVVNYGPWSNECVRLIDNMPDIINISGNHEKYFIEGNYGSGGKMAEQFFKVNFPGFIQHETIKKYRDDHALNGILFTHTVDDKYVFADSIIDIKSDHCIGHSHRQFKNNLNAFNIINPGSVGQNREAINVISYALYDADKNKFHFRQIIYNVDVVIKEMESRRFPAVCINYYKEKNRA